MEARPFNPPDPVIESVRDVRLLATCAYCERVGHDLPILESKPHGRGRRVLRSAHTYCIVTKGGGFAALAALPDEEVDKTAVYDLVALGMTFDEFNGAVTLARNGVR